MLHMITYIFIFLIGTENILSTQRDKKHYQGQIGLSLSNPAGQDMCSLYISFLFTSSIMESFSVSAASEERCR